MAHSFLWQFSFIELQNIKQRLRFLSIMGLEETSTFTYINSDAKIKTVFLKKNNKKDYRNCNSKAFIQKKIPSAALTKC